MVLDLSSTPDFQPRDDATDPVRDGRHDGSAVVDSRKTAPFAKCGKYVGVITTT